MEGQTLEPVREFSGPILAQKCSDPVLCDDWPNGRTYICGHCEKVVLARGITEDQVWGLALRCRECGQLSKFPSMPAGMVLPPSYVFIDAAEIPIDKPLQMRRVVTTGDPSAKQRPPAPQIASTSKEANAALLRSYIDQLRALMGPKFDSLRLSDHVGSKSATPPADRHPLMAIVGSLEKSIASFGADDPSIDVRCLTELHLLLEVLETWKGHPGWEQFVNGLDNEYSHTVLTLAAAQFLRAHGNSVTLHKGKGRAADLAIIPGAQRVAVEVKAPQGLRWRATELSQEEARRIVEAAAKRAGTGANGQLSRIAPGMLVLGGFHLSENDLETLTAEANKYLRRKSEAGQHAHIAGIHILTLGAMLTTYEDQGHARELKGQITARLASNPGYSGPVPFDTTPLGASSRSR